jgi:hypothetical protein
MFSVVRLTATAALEGCTVSVRSSGCAAQTQTQASVVRFGISLHCRLCGLEMNKSDSQWLRQQPLINPLNLNITPICLD